MPLLSAASTACFAAVLTLSTWSPPVLHFLPNEVNGLFRAHDVIVITAGATVELDYTAWRTNLTFVHPTEVVYEALLDVNVNALSTFRAKANRGPSAHERISSGNATTSPITTSIAPSAGDIVYNVPVRIALSMSAGNAIVTTTPTNNSCLPARSTAKACTVKGNSKVQVNTTNSDVEDLAIVLAVALDAASKETCAFATSMLDDIGTTIANATDAPQKPIPAPLPHSCNLRENKFARMISNVANGLPELFGLSVSLDIVSPSTFHAELALNDLAVDPIALGPTDRVFLPPGTRIALDLWVGGAQCPRENGITLLDDIQVFNLRMSNHLSNDADIIFNDFIADAVAKDVTELLFILFMVAGGNRTLAIPTHNGSTAPAWVMAIVTAGAVGLGICAAVASYLVHRGKVVLDKNHNEVSKWRRIAGDAVIIVGCCGGIVMFAWSNQTAAAWVKVGGELNLYSFSLGDSIRDMWEAGLYVLAVFIAVFCGFYPYFKLLAILLFSVVLQRPQSIVLQIVDLIGKFSFLDAFVMIIMAEGLAVPGIAEVHMGTSFWVFVGATCLTILLGNYATHGVRIDASVSEHHALQPDDFNDGRHHPILNHGSLYLDDLSPEPHRRSFFGLNPRSPRRFRPIVAGTAFVLVAACLAMPMFVDTIVYEMSGPGALVTGARNPYSVSRLMAKAPVPLAVLAVATVVAAPCMFAIGFARTRVLAAWVTTDVFAVACLAGLLQLRQFTQFVLGDSFAGFITITASLEWPIYPLGAAAAVSLVLSLWSVILKR